jgi:predicted secreted Zn-dependent protease
MRKRTSAVLILGLIGQSVGCARSHTTVADGQPVVEKIHHSRTYEVNPLNSDDLRRSISDQWRCGGFECKIGETRSKTSFTYGAAMRLTGLCAPTSVHVTVETTITIPHWQPVGASAARRNWWSAIQSAVLHHENRHVYIAEDGAKALGAAVMQQKAPNCQALAQTIAVTGRQEMQRVEELQQDFDRAEGPLRISAPPP